LITAIQRIKLLLFTIENIDDAHSKFMIRNCWIKIYSTRVRRNCRCHKAQKLVSKKII